MKAHFLIIIAVLCGFVSGSVSAYFFVQRMSPKVAVLDVKGIVDSKRQELVKRLQDGKGNPDDLEREYGAFLRRLDAIVDAYSKDRTVLILRREAVIEGNYRDLTPEAKRILAEAER